MTNTISSPENIFGMFSMISGLAEQIKQKANAEQQRETAKTEQTKPEDALGLIGAFAPIILGEIAQKGGKNELLEKVSQLGQSVRNTNCNIDEQNVANNIEQKISPKEDVNWEQRRFELVKSLLNSNIVGTEKAQNDYINCAFEMADKVIERIRK